MLDHNTPLIKGVYSQPYNEIVKPEQIWPVSKYFLRRWTPYLNPTRFWTVIAARQLAYRLGNKRRFECYDALLYKEACSSRANFYRIKAELEEENTVVSLFISRAPIKYKRYGDVTKPGPTVYSVRLDDILTPADATYLTTWFQSHKIQPKADAIIDLLQHAISLPPTELLAPSQSPYLNDLPAKFQAITVADIIARLFGIKIAQQPTVRKTADALHTHITGSSYIGSHYFRKEWLKLLGPGPAYLLTYLRSQCYRNEDTGELRDQVTFTKPQLADAMGVDKATLFRWLKKIDQKTPKDQPFFTFLKLLHSHKTAVNEVESTYRVQLNDPLTKDHLSLYNERLQAYPLQTDAHTYAHTTELLSETDTNQEQNKPALQKETHERDTKPVSELQKETNTNEQAHNPALQKETHTRYTNAKRESHSSPTLQNETASVAKWDTNKYLTTLIKTLEKDSNSTFASAIQKFPDLISNWKFEENDCLRPFSQTAVSTIDDFCQATNIHGRRSRNVIAQSSLRLEQLVAWSLYAQIQPGITQEMTPGYLINRAREEEAPPAEFEQLANLSWELWRCYASLLLLPLRYRDDWQNAPHFDLWLTHYSQHDPEDLPFGIGEGIPTFITHLIDDNQLETASFARPKSDDPEIGKTAVSGGSNGSQNLPISKQAAAQNPDQHNWHTALTELEMQMTKATFNTLLKNSHLLSREKETYVIGVPTPHAQDWLTHRLTNTVQRTLSAIVQEPITLRFEVINS